MAGRFLNALFRFEAFLAITCYLVIVCLLLSDVFMREIMGGSIWGAQRISVYLMIVTGFLGLGLAAAKGRHLRPRFADPLVPASLAPSADRSGSVIMALVFAGFAVVAVEFVQNAILYGDLARTIKIPLWIIELVVPYAFASTALRYAVFAFNPTLKPAEEISE